MKTFPAIPLLLMLALPATGCQSYHSADTYKAGELGTSGTVDTGVVLSVREVTVEPDNNYLGTATGAVVGGAVGSTLGKGNRANTIGAAVGAVIGGIVGSEAQQVLERRKGWEVVVQRDRDQQRLAVVQLSGDPLQAGQPVQIIQSGYNRYRVTPRSPSLPPE